MCTVVPSIASTRRGGFLTGAVGSTAWGRSGPGTLADASCQDRPETTGREDCAAGGPGLRPVPHPPNSLSSWAGGHRPLSCPKLPFSPTGPWGLEQQLRPFCPSAGSVVPDFSLIASGERGENLEYPTADGFTHADHKSPDGGEWCQENMLHTRWISIMQTAQLPVNARWSLSLFWLQFGTIFPLLFMSPHSRTCVGPHQVSSPMVQSGKLRPQLDRGSAL